ncbi:SHOCT domain-containing protein [Halobaculum lipolyticum]|uniref:SHOCT domain-containing protein n=1 Tax=Halobaculum lipolyticum TaxID=3032001 RepID=UPI0024C42350|nr:SHOCT domain-containing protein [Halobaculum sp. DT31]
MTTPLDVLAQVGPHGPMGPHGPAGGGWTGGGWMGGGALPWLGPWGGFLATLLLLGLVAVTVYAAVTLARRERVASDGDRGDDALAVLDRRYARGEVDDEEYAERRERLTGN